MKSDTIEIIPTNTCPSTLAELAIVSESIAAYAPWVQLDVSDGSFTPVISWPYADGQWTELERMAARGETLPHADRLSYEAHLMVDDPVRPGELLARIGCARIIAHRESFTDAKAVREAYAIWKSAGASEVGCALMIETPLDKIASLVSESNVVQLMSIACLGAQGAAYDVRVLERIAALHTEYPNLCIEVDGGVSMEHIAALVRAGARRFGVGSAIAKADNPSIAYQKILARAESAI